MMPYPSTLAPVRLVITGSAGMLGQDLVAAARAASHEVVGLPRAELDITDADTVVSPTWLSDQLALDADAVCGSIAVDDWSPHGVHAGLIHRHFLRTYSDRIDISKFQIASLTKMYEFSRGKMDLPDSEFEEPGMGSGSRTPRKLVREAQKTTATTMISIGALLALPVVVISVIRAVNRPESARGMRRRLDSIRRDSKASHVLALSVRLRRKGNRSSKKAA